MGVAVLVVSAPLGWLSLRLPPGQPGRLQDGTGLDLVGVTFGRDHRYVAGNFWQRLRETLAPAPVFLIGGMGEPIRGPGLVETDEAVPVLWFRWKNAGAPNTRLSTTLVDEHGCRLVSDPPQLRLMRPAQFDDGGLPIPKTYQDISPVLLGTYPRRGGRVRYEVWEDPRRGRRVRYAVREDSAREPAAVYAVQFPSAGLFPTWKGAALPVTAASGPARFVLERMEHPDPADPAATARAWFRYPVRGAAGGNWRPEKITVSDATGNSTFSESNYADERRSISFKGLCTREPAWKLRVTFERAEPERAPPHALWEVPSLSVLPIDRLAEPNVRFAAGPVKLRVRRVIGGGSVSWNGGGGSYANPTMVVAAIAPRGGYTLSLLKGVDQAGRVFPTTDYAHGELTAGESERRYSLHYPPGTRSFRLTFALHRTHTVEFLVRP